MTHSTNRHDRSTYAHAALTWTWLANTNTFLQRCMRVQSMLLGWMTPEPGIVSDKQVLPFSWLVAGGKNAAYDTFPCACTAGYRTGCRTVRACLRPCVSDAVTRSCGYWATRVCRSAPALHAWQGQGDSMVRASVQGAHELPPQTTRALRRVKLCLGLELQISLLHHACWSVRCLKPAIGGGLGLACGRC